MGQQEVAAVEEMYSLARRGDRAALRACLHDDVTWEPARPRDWKACTTADEVVQTLLWRARANKLRPHEKTDLGDRVLMRMHGRRLDRLGARGWIAPQLFQIVAVRDGRIASIRDYGTRGDAYAAAGLKT